MGQIIQRKAAGLIPIQQSVQVDALRYLLPFFKKRKHTKLFPPVIRSCGPGIIVLNGHNRLVLADLFDVPLNMYRMDHRNDEIDPRSYPDLMDWDKQKVQDYLFETNYVIGWNYCKAERWALEMQSRGYHTIQDLHKKNGITLAGLEEHL